MSNPMFSVLLPTRQRPHTFRHPLRNVLSQEYEYYEVVVADNCSDPETGDIVREVNSPRVVYNRSESVLSMADNWERGLALCKGRYVTILGDDDALMTDAMRVAEAFVTQTESEIIAWHPHNYWWPDTIVELNRNLLFVNQEAGHQRVAAKAVLGAFFRNAMGFDQLPMIYSSFVSRELIQRACEQYGRYFIDLNLDLASGVLNAHMVDTYVICGRALSVRGISGRSIGTSHFCRSRGAHIREAWMVEEKKKVADISHPDLVPTPNLEVGIAATKLRLKAILFPEREDYNLDVKALLMQMAAGINRDPDSYEDTLADMRAIAEKYNINMKEISIPAKDTRDLRNATVAQGVMKRPDGSVHMIVINGRHAGIENVAQAARFARAVMPIPA